MTLMLAKNRFGRVVLHLMCLLTMGNGAGIGLAFAVSFIVRAITSTKVRSPAELATLDTM